MKERPILMAGDLVVETLAGRKTQTRRPLRPQPPSVEAVHARAGIGFDIWRDPKNVDVPFRPVGPVWAVRDLMGTEPQWPCPFGAPGDRLCVRETFRVDGWDSPDDAEPWATFEYRADGASRRVRIAADDRDAWCDAEAARIRREGGVLTGDGWQIDRERAWRPSIHMPRWASRLTLEVVSVRVERVQDITEEDAIAEGMTPPSGLVGGFRRSARDQFLDLWRVLYGEGNPFVWCVSFRRCV